MVTTLRILIPADWQAQGNMQAHGGYEWVLFDQMGHVTRQGKDLLHAMPLGNLVEVILPATWVSFVQVTLPAGSRKQVQAALPYLVEDHLMSAPEQVHVAIVQSLPNQQAVLGFMDKPLLKGLMHALQTAKLYPQRVVPATLLPKFSALRWTLVSDIDTVTNQTTLFLRTEEGKGFALEAESDGSPPLALQLAVQQAKHTEHAPHDLQCYGNALPSLDTWSDILQLPCIAQSAQWKAYPPQPGINLLQGEFSPAQQGWGWLTLAKPALIAGLMVVVIELLGVSVDWAIKAHQASRLDQNMHTLFATTFPDAKNIVNPPLQMQRKLSELRHATGGMEGQDFLAMLANVSNKAGNLPRLLRMDYKIGQLTLEMQAANDEEAQRMFQKIKASGLPVQLGPMTPDQNGVHYSLVYQMSAP